MPGAGKTFVAKEMARHLDCRVITMGSVIREEAKRRGLEPTDKNLGKIMLEMRRESGPAVVAERCLEKMKDMRLGKKGVVIVDGVRSMYEVEAFKKPNNRVALIAVSTSPEKRFERLHGRKRKDDPKGWDSFRVRDRRELNVGIGDAVKVADYRISNEGEPKETKRAIADVVKKLRRSIGSL